MARKSGSIEDKKAIHVSFSDKEYCEKMQKIIGEWDDSGINRSQKVCDIVIAMNKYESSPAINKVLKTYEWVQNTIIPYFENTKDAEFYKVIDMIFNEILQINGEKLTDFLLNPNMYIEKNINQVKPTNTIPNNQSTHKSETKNTFVEEKHPDNTMDTATNNIVSEEISADNDSILTKGNEDTRTIPTTKENIQVLNDADNRTFIKKEDILNENYEDDEKKQEEDENKEEESFQINSDNLSDILRTFQ